jgi:SEC-C motif-containing protein
MRSRFSAFARREVHYLWRTLHASHPDRAQPMEAVVAAIRRSAETCRYMGLTVYDHEESTTHEVARVLFEARVFLKGRDVSFVECSDFLHDGVGWRYLAGVSVARGGLQLGPTGVTIRRFCEVHGH